MVPPQEIMVKLIQGGYSKVCDLDALRVDSVKDTMDDPVFTSRIHGLENN